MKVLLFDIDGTLLLSGGAGKIAIERTFKLHFGVEDCWGEVMPHGKTDPLIFDEIAVNALGRPLTHAEFKSLCNTYVGIFSEELPRSPRFRLMPGVTELVSRLAERQDCLLAIQTGNIQPIAWQKLNFAGFEGRFCFGGFGCDGRTRNDVLKAAANRLKQFIPDFEPSQLVVIGDTSYDITAGKKIGAHTVAVLTNGLTELDLRQDPPSLIFQDFTNSSAVIESLVTLS